MKISRINVYDGKDPTGFSGHVVKSENTGKVNYKLMHQPSLGKLKLAIDDHYEKGFDTIFAYTNVDPIITKHITNISNQLELGVLEESEFLDTINEELDLKK